MNRAMRPWQYGTMARLPMTFICIGGMKCGTTTLHTYFEQHPEVSVPTIKEPDFFFREHGTQNIDAYQGLFDPTKPIMGEFAPNYARAKCAVAIRQVYPDAKILLLVRDPIARVVSHLRHILWKSEVSPDEVSSALDRGMLDRLRPSLIFQGQYAQTVAHYRREGFSPHLMSFHDLVADPAAFFEHACDFVGARYDPAIPHMHSHSSEGRPTVELTDRARDHLRATFAASNQIILNEFGIDLFR